jgi:hypothetical protein
VADHFEERQVGVAVRVRRRRIEVVRLARGELSNGRRLVRPVQRADAAARVGTVFDLADRPERSVEARSRATTSTTSWSAAETM